MFYFLFLLTTKYATANKPAIANTAPKPGGSGVGVGVGVAGAVVGVVVTGVDVGVAVGAGVSSTGGVGDAVVGGEGVSVLSGVCVSVGDTVGEGVGVGVSGPPLTVNIPSPTVCAIGLLPVSTNFLTVRFSSLVSSALPVAFKVT